MGERGVGYVADVLFFASMVAFASFLLIEADSASSINSSERYVTALARDILLTFQRTTVDEFGGISYEPNLPISWASERKLRHKTLMQLFVEDAVLNPQIEVGGRIVSSSLNREFDDRVHKLFKSVLDRILAGRFGYQLIVQMTPFELPSGMQVHFSTAVRHLETDAKRLCSESVKVGIPISVEWFGGFEELGGKFGDRFSVSEPVRDLPSPIRGPSPVIIVTLELWSE